MAIVSWQYKGTKTIDPNGTYCLLCKDDKAYYCDEIYLSQSEGNYYLNYTIYILDIPSNSWTTISNQIQVDAISTYIPYYGIKYASDGEYLYFFFITYYPDGDYYYKLYCLKIPIAEGSPSLITLMQHESNYFTFALSKNYIYVCGGSSYITIYVFSKTGTLIDTESTSLLTYNLGARSNINNNYVIVKDTSNYIIYDYDSDKKANIYLGGMYSSIIIDGKLFGVIYSSGTYYLNKYIIDFENESLNLEDTLSSFANVYIFVPSTHCLVFHGFSSGTQQFKLGIANDSAFYEETHDNLFNYGASGNYGYATFYDTIFIYGM